MDQTASEEAAWTLSASYPLKPKEPKESECCGSGCQICIFDLYELDLKRWRSKCKAISTNQIKVAATVPIISIYQFKAFSITEVEIISESIKLFHFEIPNGESLGLMCGQHLMARCITSDGGYVIRPYTPVSSRKKEGSFQVAIKIYPDGAMSRCVSEWKVGVNVEWRGPFGDYRYFPKGNGKMLLLACGTGVAPMIQVMREILDNEEDETVIHLLYSIQYFDDILVKQVLDTMADFWNCHIVYHVTRESSSTLESKKKYRDRIHYSRITGEQIRTEIGVPADTYQVLICGTKSFSQDMEELCAAIGVDRKSIFKF